MFQVLFRSDLHLDFEHPFLRARSGVQIELRTLKLDGWKEICLPLTVQLLFIQI